MDKRFQGKTCPFCKTPFKEDDVIVVCSVCEMPHHLSCWQENNGCTTFGCTGTIKETIGNVTNNNDSPATSPTAVQSVQEKPVQKPEQPARRFETLFENEPNTIQGNVPVLIEKLSLIIDHQNESLMARCIFRSLTDKPIMALLVDVVCTDVWGIKAQSVEGFQFLDLKTKRDSAFGQTKPIPIPDSATRAIEVVIKKVLYADRTMVDASTDISVLPKQELLESFFASAELAKEYARESNDRAKYTTVEGDHYWRCACGAINEKEDGTCYRCHADKAQLLGLLNVELISGNLAAFNEEKRLKAEREQAEREEQLRQAEERMRLAQEEKERKEKEEAERKAEELRQKKAKRKKTVKRTSLITAAVLLVGFLVYATGWHIIPYIRYQNACKAVEAQSFDEAYNTFVALGTFSDSSEKAIDTLYQKGVYLMNNGSYLDAATEFERVPDYQDSKDQAVYCRNEAAYLDAKALLESGKYKEAAEAFTALADYEDSADQATASKYLYAQELLNTGMYKAAAEAFTALADYEDSAEQVNVSNYMYAKELLENGEYEEAHNIFKALKNYEDSKDLANESNYRLAGKLFDEGDYNEAYNLFLGLQTYKDSKDRARESKYKYALKCFDDGDYKNAVAAFSAIRDYEDVEERLPEAKYRYALALTAQSNWKEASDQFRSLGDYKDSATKFQETYYKYGLLLINQKNYKSAINVFSELGNYEDSKTRINEAKYAYVQANKNSTDTTTYSYLKDLKAAGYRDAQSIYNSLYAWRVSLVMNNSEKDETTNKSSISRYDRFYCHVKLSGGPPDGSTRLKYVLYFPDGSTYSGKWNFDWHAGTTSWCCGYYRNPSNGATGTFRVRIYYQSSGNLLGEATVTITY